MSTAIEDLAEAIIDTHVRAPGLSSNVRNIIYTGLVSELCEQSPGELEELFEEYNVHDCIQAPSGRFYRIANGVLQISLDPRAAWFDVAALDIQDVDFVYNNLGPLDG